MKIKSPLVFVFVSALIVLLSNCKSEPVQQSQNDEIPAFSRDHYVHFMLMIFEINSAMFDSTNPSTVFLNPKFKYIYYGPTDYFHDVIEFISDPSMTVRQKQIAICSMDQLRTDLYIKIVDTCYGLYKTGKVSESLLSHSIMFPQFSLGTNVTGHYNNDAVQIVLNKILKENLVSQHLKDTIAFIKSGQEHNSHENELEW
jgi:hypothetical protein